MQALLDALLPLWGVCNYQENTVLSAAFPYLLPQAHYAGRNISRYAVVRDYHGICGARLESACALLREAFPGEEFRWHCDSNALPEAALAVQAGLGVRGRHNLLITEPYGSWVFLGEIVTKAKLPGNGSLSSIRCTQCKACVSACPTGALGENGFEKTKCLSYITQKKGELSAQEAALLKKTGILWGCDLCQEACPHNRRAAIAPLPEFLLEPVARVTENTPAAGRAYAWRPGGLARNIAVLSTAACVLPSGIS